MMFVMSLILRINNNKPFLTLRNRRSYYVILEANSILLGKELFVSLDGHRYFVPVPKILNVQNSERKWYYDKQQIQLAKITREHHFEKSIYEFTKECKKSILIKD
jgi:hypothetical protein